MRSPQPRKQFAQHWLRSEKALSKIVKSALLSPSDCLLEIGPGTGILTTQLLSVARSVVAVEIDRDLSQNLVKRFGNRDNFLLLEGDILTLDIEGQLQGFPNFQNPNKVVANIPYNITGPIVEQLLGTISEPNPHPYQLIVLLVQKEVAQRITANAGSKTFGALSVRVQYLANCEYICDVPAKAFYPAPKVDSAVLRLCPRPIAHPANNPQYLETLLKLGFSSKRKMLRNNLQSVISRDQLTQLLEQLEINPQVRAEDLSVEQWVNLTNLMEITDLVTD
ncbi:16S rRNA (adenine(1518)-N(6)/adenine(1519)-N(6))-dimethyltransferase RsmA [Planktothrix agardhii]|jgi:16S rRNA (adenine1518-N6/adenine1519-N6)-dimethyltransferase|uniref:16S rRNA (adenine(1518)-N(6)/adenine(1519)-N(6))- dimethyltransferase RsmA n=1 Tax=Planktothrix agardhii TaxID=1160 RepID=UPI001D0B6D48|nr:16S rRNA (adenine(1518)-N(6)/adenine(1519)-N(6))-dimethyltransferase RsmA [Planktothrix agardhii]MCF3605209.1 16S rRNA (adenine(1518)-N(6)/adenine(1519)-N(6))-dimethyltransferase RsmA [Planktothrix agardhii 1033]MCB8749164.1 16S rRNA (adenine(1518)-N(6)/adenine(1519)-N(6))-dimethyltransferase RsmA [Planktothrix agardhii 1810]MCB8761990.1 16S rRNA (adenine(1518)-N(6)/adenine(1519)-N(6))-dimethyltransferase RsmA [Planktothrix agardhii 1813]MEA5562981.1 16S rRNA (adenine(1518)-N(6)/adenine(1519